MEYRQYEQVLAVDTPFTGGSTGSFTGGFTTGSKWGIYKFYCKITKINNNNYNNN